MANGVSSFLTGFALSAALIVAIGAQNFFVLRQGLRREHVGAVVLFCAGRRCAADRRGRRGRRRDRSPRCRTSAAR